MGARHITEKECNNIILLEEKGCTTDNIVDITGFSRTTVNNILRINILISAGHIDEARKESLGRNAKVFGWVCARYGIDPQPPKEKPIETPLDLADVLPLPKYNTEAKPETTPTDTKGPEESNAVEEAIFVASRLIIEKTHEDLEAMTNAICSKLERLMTIGQSCVMDITQKNNANADNIMREVQAIKSHVEMIRSYSKKRK